MNSIRIKGLLLFVVCSFATKTIQSQNVAINASGSSANLSAILDLDGVTSFTGPNGYKGLLIPRMTNAQRTGIVTLPAAAQGLVVYQTDGIEGFYYNTSTTTTPNWLYLTSSATGDWATTGNTGTTASTAAIGATVTNNFIGTTDAKDFVFASNNLERMRLFSSGQLSIGSKTVGAKLDVQQTTGTAVGRFTTFTNPNDIELRRAQGTQAVPTATTGSGTVLGRISAQGYDGGSYTSAASISMETDATGGTSTDMPGRIVFNTATDGTGTLTERMRIDNLGYVGIGTTSANTSLDVNGAYSARLTVAAAAAANVIPNNVSLYRLTAVAGVQANALSVAGPQNGQFLTIINEDGDAATFAGFTIPAASGVSGIGSFVYSSTAAAWSAISLYPPTVGGTAWSITGNAGTVAGTNFIGTTDNIPFCIKVNNQKAGRIDHLLANAFFGYQAGNANSTGFFNVAYGNQTLLNNTTGSYNTALGVNALYFSTSGTNNTATGYQAMYTNTTGANNTALGFQSLYSNNTGIQNVAVGTYALNANTRAQDNIAIGGYYAMSFSDLRSQNIALGTSSLNMQGQGGFQNGGTAWSTYNIAIGGSALNNTDQTATTDGIGNIGIGYLAGTGNTFGTYNTILGYSANVGSGSLTNATAIGANATVSSSNAVVLGSSASVLIGRSTTVNNAKLSIKDGHIQVSQTTAPTIAVSANAGTAGAAIFTVGITSNDIAGQITLTEGTASWLAGAQCTVTFNRAYTSAPIVVLTPINAAAASGASSQQVFVTSTTTTFVINFGIAAAGNANWKWNYIVIEP